MRSKSDSLAVLAHRSVTLSFRRSACAVQPDFTRSVTTITASQQNGHKISEKSLSPGDVNSSLSHLPTSNLVRNLLFGVAFSSPLLFNPSMAMLRMIANAKSPWLNPDRNILFKALLRPLVYSHFCAGETRSEVTATIRQIKSLGFAGVILGNAKEILIRSLSNTSGRSDARTAANELMQKHVQAWLQLNLETVDMIGSGDILALKFTGAGPEVSDLLAEGAPMPQVFSDAFDELCSRVHAKGSRIFVDAEPTDRQATVAAWTIELMRRHNTRGDTLILTTIQAYLKTARETVTAHLEAARKENWVVGIKLVRGAYIESEPRSLIHDTKAETDTCYNGIVKDLVSKTWPGFTRAEFPTIGLFVAGHNQESVHLATNLARKLAQGGEKVSILGYGQLQGMADEVSCGILEAGKQAEEECNAGMSEAEAACMRVAVPRAYKCLTWGSIQECMGFLVRRAAENRGATERIKEGMPVLRAELWRRMTFRSKHAPQ